MRLQKLRCEHCKKRYMKRGEGQKYCSHRCRQAAYRQRKQGFTTAKKHPVTTKQKAELTLIPAVCDHCDGNFWAKSKRAKFCGTSCRVMHHRAMKAAIPDALAFLHGVPLKTGADILETMPIARVKALLKDRGWLWNAQSRAWVQPIEQMHQSYAK